MNVMQILPWAIFGCITCIVLGLLSFMNARKSRAVERLDELRDPTLREKEKLKEKHGMAAALEKAAPALSQALAPKTDIEKNVLRLRLANAGFNNPNAPSIYLTLKLIMLGFGLLSGLFSLAMVVPSIAVGARRLHDLDKSGWWLLIGLIPLVGAALVAGLEKEL